MPEPNSFPPHHRIAGQVPGGVSSAADAPAVHRIISPSGAEFAVVVSVDMGPQAQASTLPAAEAGSRLLIWPKPMPRDQLPWLPGARRRFEERCDLIAERSPECTPVLWPNAASAVGDAPSLATFLRSRPRWGFVFDPVSMLTPDMLERAEDHFLRFFELLGSHPQAHAVVLAAGRAIGERVVPVAAMGGDDGLWSLAAILCERHCPATLPILLGTE